VTSPDLPLPVTVIGGYLGAGKTTLVNHLLRHADGRRLAILVNEFGELAIDEDLIEAEDDDIISIAGGCVCCSFGSDLTAALMQMADMQPRPDHIVIESSGVAIPAAIVASVGLLTGFSADGIIVLADAETVRRNADDIYMGDTIMRQFADADIVLLNKTDLVDPDVLAQTHAWLKATAPQAQIVDCVNGVVAPDLVLGSFLARAHTPGPHHEAAHLAMLTLRPKAPLDVEKLAQALADPAMGLVRAKGFATGPDGQKKLVQVVSKRWQVTDAGADFADGIVCLGFKPVINQTALQALIA